jgi:hypothetical protein
MEVPVTGRIVVVDYKLAVWKQPFFHPFFHPSLSFSSPTPVSSEAGHTQESSRSTLVATA